MNYRSDIDGLRAVAVLPVVLYHAGTSIVPGGYVGVDIFFVISGFLITKIISQEINDRRLSLLGFYERRVRRILPAYFAMVLACAIAGWFVLLPADFEQFGQSVLASLVFVSNIFFWQQSADYFAAPAEFYVLLHTWSLAVEEQFYLFFPVGLACLAWVLRKGERIPKVSFLARRLPLSLFAVIFLIALISFVLAAFGAVYKSSASFYLLPTRAWELLLGSLLAFGVIPAPGRGQRVLCEGLAVAGLALILMSILTYSDRTAFPGLAAVPPTVGAALLLYVGLGHEGVPATVVSKLLATRPMRFVGLISYSLYLWHWPVIVFWKYYYGIEKPDFGGVLVLVVVSVVLATLSWKYIERPFRDRRRWSRPQIFAGAGACGASLAAIGLVLIVNDGMTGRVTQDVAALSDWGRYVEPETAQCHQAFDARKTIETLCVRGATENLPSFVLIGDSHGGALAPGIFEAARQAGKSGYQVTQMGWRYLPSYYSLTTLGAVHSAKAVELYLEELLEEDVLAQPSVTDVVYVAYFQQALRQHYEQSARPSAIVRRETAVTDGLVKLVQRYPDKRFTFVLDVPHSLTFGSVQAAKAKHFEAEFRPRISVVEYEKQVEDVRRIMENVAEHGNVKIISLADEICDEKFCYGAHNGRTLYRDDNHLTAEFARSLAPALKSRIELFDEDEKDRLVSVSFKNLP